MRTDVTTVNVTMTIGEFAAMFPLGSKTQVVAIDDDRSYAGLVVVAEAHGPEADPAAALDTILHHRDAMLLPSMNVRQAVSAFDVAEAETLAVVDAGDRNRVIGLLTEAHALRRYAEESERRRREMMGDT